MKRNINYSVKLQIENLNYDLLYSMKYLINTKLYYMNVILLYYTDMWNRIG